MAEDTQHQLKQQIEVSDKWYLVFERYVSLTISYLAWSITSER